MPSVLRQCIGCRGRFARQYFSFSSETCRLCTTEKAMKDCQDENKELKCKVKILEDFVTSHIGVDASIIHTDVTAQISASPSYDAEAASAITPNTLPSPPTPEQVCISDQNFEVVTNGARVKSEMPIMPVMTQNSFGPLADLMDEPEDSIIVGDSIIRHQLEEFCGRAPKQRKRYCFPGAKIDRITNSIEEIVNKEKSDSVYIVHVGTNDIKTTNSEELMERYKRLIMTLKAKRSKFIISGILPRIGAEGQFYNKAFSTNDRLKSFCSKENVEFINLWNHFYDQQILFNRDGIHLNPVGSARFGRLLNDALNAYRTKNWEQRGPATPP